MKFKVGDRVRVVKSLLNVKAALGKEATIETLGPPVTLRFSGDILNDSGYGANTWFAQSEEIGLVSQFKDLEVIEPEKPQPKVGEFVRFADEYVRVVAINQSTMFTLQNGQGRFYASDIEEIEPIKNAV